MTITFTAEELGKFAQDLTDWYNQLTIYVLEHFQLNPMSMGRGGDKEEFHRLAKQFQTEHPKPDWRQIL